jgi:hypothetical protein
MRERIEKILERRTGEGIVDWLRQAYQANVTSSEKPSVSKGTP